MIPYNKRQVVRCNICHREQMLSDSHLFAYSTDNPLFKACRLISCESCKGAWVDTPPSPDALKNYYKKHGGRRWPSLDFMSSVPMTLERCQALARWNFVDEALRGVCREARNSKMSVCDIGAGFGCTYEVRKYQGVEIDYHAFESSPYRRAKIEKMGMTAYSDLFENASDNQYDLVWASHILEHFSDPDILLLQMKNRMKPKGAGFLEIPFLDFEFKKDLAPHLLFFTPEGLKSVVERNGLRLARMDSVGSFRHVAGKQFEERGGAGFLKSKLRRLPFRKTPSVCQDLQRKDVFEKWQLENYGGDRCWIRALFLPA